MSAKTLIIELIERRWIGAIFRIAGRSTRYRSHLKGLINPFHLPTTLVDNGGSRLIAYPNSYLDLAAGLNRAVRLSVDTYEPEISYLIGSLIKEDDVVLDIGANVGLHTVKFAQIAKKGHVFAFEPVKEMAERLSQNCALNRLENVTIVESALGERSEMLPIAVNIAGAGLEGTSSLVESFHVEDHPENYKTRNVPVRRLDDLIEELGIDGRIGFIKMDTEGFETFVLEGAGETVRKNKPIMIIEAHSRRLEKAGKSFEWYLEKFPDYHVFILPAISRTNPYLRLEPLRPGQPEIAVNLVLLPRTNSHPL